MNRRVLTKIGISCFALAAAALLGCRGHMPHAVTWPASGDVIPTHPKPPEGGYYSNWDPYAACIELEPLVSVNPVGTQHVFIATVKDKNGKPLPNRRVEWMISEGSVGEIVEVDESGWRASRGYKMSNTFAVSHTNNFAHTITRGNDDPADDIHLGEGQTWCVITSPVEGTTSVTAYAPGIYDWSKHKVFATKHWMDVSWQFPADATNPVGTTHEFTTYLKKHSDGSPLVGYVVNYRIVSGPAGTLQPGGGTSATVTTDGAGAATVTLAQASPAEGVNEIEIDVIRPANEKCCGEAKHIMSGRVTKRWIAPKLEIRKEAPAERTVGQEFDYRILVSNSSSAEAKNVIVSDALPDGITYISSDPPAKTEGQTLKWSLGNMAGQAGATLTVHVRAGRIGKFSNCADAAADGGLAARACADTVVTAPKLSVEFECRGEALLCETVSYVVKVFNTGDATATGVMLEVTLPEGMKTDDGRTTVKFNAGDIGPGRAKQGRFNVKSSHPGKYNITGVITADGGIKLDTACATTVKQPVLTLAKTGPQNRFAGRPATFEITVTNTGDAPAADTVLVDPIPAGMKVSEISDNGQSDGGKVRWSLGTLEPGATRKVSVTMIATQIGVVKNTVNATAVCAEAFANATLTVEGIPAILLEVVDIEDPIEVGANTTYEIIVTNQGSADDHKITIVCDVPAEEDFVSASGPTNGRAEGKRVTFDPLASLAPSAKAVYRVVVKGNAPADVRFKTTMTTEQHPEVVTETESTHVYK